MAAKTRFTFYGTMLSCIVLFLLSYYYLTLFYRRHFSQLRDHREPKPKEKDILPLLMYADPASNQDILNEFADKIDCSISSRMMFNFQYLNVTFVCGKIRDRFCQKWFWDVANGTIIYSNESVRTALNQSISVCAYPVQGERVQKIVFANGATQYPGCSWANKQCAPYKPHYDKKLRLRINTGPCCRKLWFDYAHDVKSLFDEHNITHIAMFGCVIGWVRDRAYIPYDFDIDLMINYDARAKVPTLQKEFKTKGYVLKYVHGKTRLWACKRDDCPYTPGIWFYRILDGGKRVSVFGKVYPFEDFFPPQRGILDGHEFWFPAKPENYLNAVYGKGKWKKVYYCDVLAANGYCAH